MREDFRINQGTESGDLGFQLPKFLAQDSATLQVQEEGRSEVAKIQLKISANPKHSTGIMKTNFFRRTPGREKGVSSCPSIKGVFHKLLNDLNAPVELQNSHASPILNETTDRNCVSLQLDDFDGRCEAQEGPGADIDPSSIKSFNEIVRRTSYSSDGGSESNMGMIIENGGIVAQLGKALSVEENEDGLSQKLNQALTVGPDAIAAIAVDKSRLNSGVKTTNELLEEKMFEIDKILGISMEGKIEDLRSFIHEMLTEEQSCRKMGIQSRKKSRAQRELDKLASSINYDHPTGDKRYGVKLWGL